eukprot:SAG31_NODE_263_length_18841_cov_17.270996_4_plen_191_part_00
MGYGYGYATKFSRYLARYGRAHAHTIGTAACCLQLDSGAAGASCCAPLCIPSAWGGRLRRRMPGRQRSRSTARAARVLAHVAPAGATGLGDWGSVSDAPRPSYYRAPRLEVGSSELKSHLGEHGYAVAKCVLSPSQCKAAISKLWDFLEACTSGLIDRRDVKTWRDEHWPASGAGATFLSAYGASPAGLF